jgi:PAS domain S-box-containing protein
LLQNPGIQIYESTAKDADGVDHDVIFHEATFPNMDGSVGGLIGAISDISALKRVQKELAFNNIILRTQQESSIDGILVADEKGEVLSFNHRYVDLWDIPSGVIESKSDGHVLQSVMDKLACPEEFIRKVKHLYEVRDEISRDEIFLKDGRVFDYYSAPMLGADEQNYGRVWYFRDVTERKRAEENLKETAEKLRKSLLGTIQAMSLMVETRDPYTAGHQRRVSKLARVIAQEMALPSDTVDTIRIAGLIHDIGKISIPSEILSKPGKLSDTEFSLIKIHSQSGYNILKDVGLPYPIAEMVLQHHERLDGSGYPQGLTNGRILLESQIITIADVVEAMASHRPYRSALGIDVALEEIEKNKGTFYDTAAVEACIKLVREKGFTFE